MLITYHCRHFTSAMNLWVKIASPTEKTRPNPVFACYRYITFDRKLGEEKIGKKEFEGFRRVPFQTRTRESRGGISG